MVLNKSKIKKIKTWLEPEPNFPRVATPKSSEWIIYIISYTYNPFTAPWEGQLVSLFTNMIDVTYQYITVHQYR